MALQHNFTSVSLNGDGTLTAVGQSQETIESIFVTLLHNGSQPIHARVDEPIGSGWQVAIAIGHSAVASGDRVTCVGMAMRSSHDPFIWHDTFTIR